MLIILAFFAFLAFGCQNLMCWRVGLGLGAAPSCPELVRGKILVLHKKTNVCELQTLKNNSKTNVFEMQIIENLNKTNVF